MGELALRACRDRLSVTVVALAADHSHIRRLVIGY
jgi:hypothetical protein